MRCIHCGSVAGRAREKELTVDECLGVANDLIDLRCKRVTLIGGEIFLYKGWEEVARTLHDGGTTVNIITNAFLFGDDQIEQIKYGHLANVGISLDGMEKNHNRIRNSETSFQRVLKAFGLLSREGIQVAVVTSLLDINFYDLDSMYDLLVDNNITIWQIQIANAMGNMAIQKNMLIDPVKISLITKFIREKRNRQEIQIYAGDNIGYYDENEPYLRNSPGTITVWQGCQAGLRVLGIDSMGNIKGCESLYSDDFIEGNLRQESLKDIWCNESNFAYNRQFDVSHLSGACAECDKGRICRGGCRGSCYFATGSRFENAFCCYPGKRAI